MLGSGPLTGAPLASSFGEIIVASLDHGSFTATGQAATFDFVIPADSASFTLTGQEAGLIRGRGLSPDVTTF